jgi:hypothetical protein
MALIDSTTTWSGKEADGFYSAALLTGGSKETFRTLSNVKSKINVYSFATGNILQPDSCSVDESGDYTLDNVVVEVCDIAFNVPICVQDFHPLWLSETMRPGANVEENFPAGFIDYIRGYMLDKINADVTAITWSGDTAGSPASLCDGILKGLLADSAVLDVQSPTTLTESNIIDEMTKALKRIPKAIKNKGKQAVRWYISTTAASLYEIAIYDAHPALLAQDRDTVNLTFAGYTLIVDPGMPDNTMVITDPMNLIYANDLASDEKSITLKQNPIPGSEDSYNFVGRFKIGFDHLNGAEIVLYGTGS